MSEPRNRVVQLTRVGGPEWLAVVDAARVPPKVDAANAASLILS
jgi:hypothetical protein